MINDPTMAIDCDNCYTTIFYHMPFIFDEPYNYTNGHYSSYDAYIEEFVKEVGWVVDNDKQFCCEECMRKFYDRGGD